MQLNWINVIFHIVFSLLTDGTGCCERDTKGHNLKTIMIKFKYHRVILLSWRWGVVNIWSTG